MTSAPPDAEPATGRGWALLPLLLGAVTFGLLLAAVAADGPWVARDERLLDWFAAHRTPGVTGVLSAITAVFGQRLLPILVTAGCLLWAWRGRSWRGPLLLAAAMVLSTALSQLLKALAGRPRPADEIMVVPGLETSAAFPSGHTIAAATLVLAGGYLWWLARPTRGVVLVVAFAAPAVIVLVGLTRLYLGYHFLTDVLAGIAVALVVLGILVLVSPPGRRRLPSPSPQSA